MAADASHALGAPEVAGSFVNPKGLTKKMTAQVAGGVVGGAAGRFAATMKTGPPYQGAPDVPNFGRVGYVAVTENEVALVKTKTGMIKMKISDQVLARAPRSQIAFAELDKGHDALPPEDRIHERRPVGIRHSEAEQEDGRERRSGPCRHRPLTMPHREQLQPRLGGGAGQRRWERRLNSAANGTYGREVSAMASASDCLPWPFVDLVRRSIL